MKLRPNKTESAARCAFCHDEEGEFEACSGCGTLLHAECAAEGCPSLGCVKRTPRQAARWAEAAQVQQVQVQQARAAIQREVRQWAPRRAEAPQRVEARREAIRREARNMEPH